MKTTLDLPDDLVKAVKIRAVEENRRLKDVIADLLRRGLEKNAAEPPHRPARRVKLPLVECAHPAGPEDEITPERAAEILLDQEIASIER